MSSPAEEFRAAMEQPGPSPGPPSLRMVIDASTLTAKAVGACDCGCGRPDCIVLEVGPIVMNLCSAEQARSWIHCIREMGKAHGWQL